MRKSKLLITAVSALLLAPTLSACQLFSPPEATINPACPADASAAQAQLTVNKLETAMDQDIVLCGYSNETKEILGSSTIKMESPYEQILPFNGTSLPATIELPNDTGIWNCTEDSTTQVLVRVSEDWYKARSVNCRLAD